MNQMKLTKKYTMTNIEIFDGKGILVAYCW